MTDWKPTACILCECNCGLEVQLGGEDGRHLVKLRGDKRHPSSQGYACEKPHRLDHYQHGRDRMTSPLRRRADGTFEAIDWDTAIREVAARLAAVRDTHGGDTIFYYGGGGQGNHLPARVRDRDAARARLALSLERARAGEDRRVLGQRPHDGQRRRAPTSSTATSALFLGKNPWHSHSIPRARVTLKEIAADPARTLIVDRPAAHRDRRARRHPPRGAARAPTRGCSPRSSRSSSRTTCIDHAFLDAHARRRARAGARGARARFRSPRACDARRPRRGAGAPRRARDRRRARVRQLRGPRRADEPRLDARQLPAPPADRAHRQLRQARHALHPDDAGRHRATARPSTRARSSARAIVGGLVPCNVIADEILTDHPKRYRAMIVEATNPAHSLADSKRMREALGALDTLVVIDVAMTETARLAALRPARRRPSSRRRRRRSSTSTSRATTSTCAAPLFAPPPGTLPEAEIHARLVRGARRAHRGRPRAAARGREARAAPPTRMALMRVAAADPRLGGQAPVAPLPHARICPTSCAKARSSSGSCLRAAMEHGRVARARRLHRHADRGRDRAVRRDPRQPSRASCSPSTNGPRCRPRSRRPTGKIHLPLPDLLAELDDAAAPAPEPRAIRRSRSCSPPASAARSPRTRSSAIRRGARRTPAARCASARTTRPRSASPPASRCGSPRGATRVVVAVEVSRLDAARPRLAAERPRARLPVGVDGERDDRRRAERAHRRSRIAIRSSARRGTSTCPRASSARARTGRRCRGGRRSRPRSR